MRLTIEDSRCACGHLEYDHNERMMKAPCKQKYCDCSEYRSSVQWSLQSLRTQHINDARNNQRDLEVASGARQAGSTQ